MAYSLHATKDASVEACSACLEAPGAESGRRPVIRGVELAYSFLVVFRGDTWREAELLAHE
jgi:hypothetical protein